MSAIPVGFNSPRDAYATKLVYNISSIMIDSKNIIISICMPAYNEEENIERTVRDSFKAIENQKIHGEVVVTDDCSKDKTPQILASLKKEFPDLIIVTHTGRNEGYGRALRDAIKASSGEFVATIDSDGQFDILELGKLYNELNPNIDMVIGYRMGKKDSIFKVFADRGLNLLVRLMFGLNVRDSNCAFKLIKGDLIRALNIETNGYQTPTEILLKMHYKGARFKQVGITHRARKGGKSSLKIIKTSWDFFCFLVYMRHKVTLWRRRVLADL